MSYVVDSTRQCAGACSGETHQVIRVTPDPEDPNKVKRTTVAVFRRRDMAEELCAEFNSPLGFLISGEAWARDIPEPQAA